MDLSGHPELDQIFRSEIDAHAATLAEGAHAMQAGAVGRAQLDEMKRAAHTIKGNAAVMSYPRISDVARRLEILCGELHVGVRAQSAELGARLAEVAELLPASVDAERAGGPADLLAAAERLDDLPPGEPVAEPDGPSRGPQPADPDPEVSGPSEAPDHLPGGADDAEVSAPGRPEPENLGGLVSDTDPEFPAEMTSVDAARLYEVINRVVEAALDVHALSGEVERLRLAVGSAGAEYRSVFDAVKNLGRSMTTARDRALDLIAVPLSVVTTSFPQLVRYMARRVGKDVRLERVGDDVDVDRQVVELLREPLRHLVVNAVDHGIEPSKQRAALGKSPTGRITLEATVRGEWLVVEVSDDGRGIDWDKVADRALLEDWADGPEPDLAALLTKPGFTTSDAPDISGDGIGLALVAENVRQLNGRFELRTEPGAGSTAIITVPRSRAIQNVLVVRAAGHSWGLPAASVLGIVGMPAGDGSLPVFDGERIPVVAMAEVMGLPQDRSSSHVVVIATRQGPLGVAVERLQGERHVVVKELGAMLVGSPHVAGAALLGGDDVVAIVDPTCLGPSSIPTSGSPRVLVVDDSRSARHLVAAALAAQGFAVTMAKGTNDAVDTVRGSSFDAVVVDYAMPGPDGIALIRAVRSMVPSLPIVMVSAVADPEVQTRAFAAGADAFLDKSDFREGVLASTLNSLLLAEVPR